MNDTPSSPIVIRPIGYVRSDRREAIDDGWDRVSASIELSDEFSPDALSGIQDFSHAEILFHLHGIDETSIETATRHPRGNRGWPRVGIFAQRGRSRPNRLGVTIVRILGVDGRALRVAGLDAIDGTPVVDIKPVMVEMLPRGELRQPQWARELMRTYW